LNSIGTCNDPFLPTIIVFGIALLLAVYRVYDVAVGRCVEGCFALDTTALYRVSLATPGYEPFYCWFNFDTPSYRSRLTGQYERPCFEVLDDIVDEDTTFWEVGAGWGYFSLALADRVDEVVAFEPLESRSKLLVDSITENGYDNVELVADAVEDFDSQIEKRGVPDVVVMDIDGWEYDVLRNSPNALDAEITWIVEIHEEQMGTNPPDPELIKPDATVDLFREHGYDMTRIDERERSGETYAYHVVAVGCGGADAVSRNQ